MTNPDWIEDEFGLKCPECTDRVMTKHYLRQGFSEPESCRACGYPDVPDDAYGPGYVIHNLDEYFGQLMAMIGPEAARQEMAEVINNRFAGRRA